MNSSLVITTVIAVGSVSLVVLLATVAGILGWRCRKQKRRLSGEHETDIEMVRIHQVKDVFTLTAIQYIHTPILPLRAHDEIITTSIIITIANTSFVSKGTV